MVTNTLSLYESPHPSHEAEENYNALIGIDSQKEKLLLTLSLLLDKSKLERWKEKHHKNGPPIVKKVRTGSPLVILSGDVGCGKTALANSIATPLAKMLNQRISVFETPSNIRGSGMVGELSNRITAAFAAAKSKLRDGKIGILIIDEADDIATSRAQNHAHHEDRAGLNVLIKQIDSIKRENCNLAVILITNRIHVLDPAVRRRASLQLYFDRPTGKNLHEIFNYIFDDIELKKDEIAELRKIVEEKEILYSFSDLIEKAGKQAIFQAIKNDEPFSFKHYKTALKSIEPSPVIEEASILTMNNNGKAT